MAYNLANFQRALVLPTAIADWSLTSLQDRMIKVGATAVRHNRSVILQLAEVAVPRDLWAQMLLTIAGLKARAQALWTPISFAIALIVRVLYATA